MRECGKGLFRPHRDMEEFLPRDDSSLLVDCLERLDSLSSLALSLHSARATRVRGDIVRRDETCPDHTIELVRTIELVKAQAPDAPKEALLDLHHRLRSTCIAPMGGQNTRALSHDIQRSTEDLDSCRRTMLLYRDLDHALCEHSTSNWSGCDEYIDSRYENEDLPLPPPLKVLRTFWPNRRIGTFEHLRRRDEAHWNVAKWQKGVLGMDGKLVETGYRLHHTCIAVSAKLHQGDKMGVRRPCRPKSELSLRSRSDSVDADSRSSSTI